MKTAIGVILSSFLIIAMSHGVYEAKNMAAYPAGIRLNNPGNIKKDDGNQWRGMTRLQDDKKFIRFKTPQSGVRALARILINYKRLHHLDTITDIVHRYAPVSENNTLSYIRDVSARSGFFPNELLDMNDIFTLTRLCQAIVIHENGLAPLSLPAAWYEDDIYVYAIEDALAAD